MSLRNDTPWFGMLHIYTLLLGLAGSALAAQTTGVGSVPPKTWIDPETGHRVTRITNEPGSKAIYFNDNAFTLENRVMVYDANHSIYVLDLRTKQSHMLVTGPVKDVVVARLTPIVYFTKPKDTRLYSVDVQTNEVRKVTDLPPFSSISSLNANEKILAGTCEEKEVSSYALQTLPPGIRPSRSALIEQRRLAAVPMALFTVNLSSGEMKTILRSTDWINHVLFSPTDPNRLLYAHEGLWENVDRIWTILSDGSENKLVHVRTMARETAGHEFWGVDGHTIWYDLQLPKEMDFYLASYNVQSGERRRVHMTREEWSLHFNRGQTDEQFCGDGGDEFESGGVPGAKYIELYSVAGETLRMTHLVNIEGNNYVKTEPNARFSPDFKSVIFTANIGGQSYIYMVDVTTTKQVIATTAATTNSKTATANATIRRSILIRDDLGTPRSNVSVAIKSLDDGGERLRYMTDSSGVTPYFNLERGFYRITVSCPDSSCKTTLFERSAKDMNAINELIVPRSDTNANVITVNAPGRVVSLTVKSEAGKVLAERDILVRSEDAAYERWYRTDANGAASVTLPSYSPVIVVLDNRQTFTFKPTESCTQATGRPGALNCLGLGPTSTAAEVTLP